MKDMPPAENAKRQFCRVDPSRLEIAVGDIALSYSVDEISAGRPLRKTACNPSRRLALAEVEPCSAQCVLKLDTHRYSPNAY